MLVVNITCYIDISSFIQQNCFLVILIYCSHINKKYTFEFFSNMASINRIRNRQIDDDHDDNDNDDNNHDYV